MSLLDLIFPINCLGCGYVGVFICANCLGKVKKTRPTCPVCRKASIDGFTHIKCKTKYGLDGLLSLWCYEGIIKKAITTLKYKYATGIAASLSELIVKELEDLSVSLPQAYCLVPIPLHWFRENYRGFNQSYELGRVVAAKMRWKFVPDLLIRKKLNTPQVKLSAEERRLNIKEVFSIAPGTITSEYTDIILFDDVFTTGSTLKEASKILKRNGVKNVWGLTIAR